MSLKNKKIQLHFEMAKVVLCSLGSFGDINNIYQLEHGLNCCFVHDNQIQISPFKHLSTKQESILCMINVDLSSPPIIWVQSLFKVECAIGVVTSGGGCFSRSLDQSIQYQMLSHNFLKVGNTVFRVFVCEEMQQVEAQTVLLKAAHSMQVDPRNISPKQLEQILSQKPHITVSNQEEISDSFDYPEIYKKKDTLGSSPAIESRKDDVPRLEPLNHTDSSQVDQQQSHNHVLSKEESMNNMEMLLAAIESRGGVVSSQEMLASTDSSLLGKKETSINQRKKRTRESFEKESLKNSTKIVSKSPKVLFTKLDDSILKHKVISLGGSVASSSGDFTHLVVDKFRRNVKFFTAVCEGKPILHVDWIFRSAEAGEFLPEDDFILHDSEAECKYNFSLKGTLARCRENGEAKGRILRGKTIFATSGCDPPRDSLKEFVVTAGGLFVTKVPRKSLENVIAIAGEKENVDLWLKKGLEVFTADWIFAVILKQSFAGMEKYVILPYCSMKQEC